MFCSEPERSTIGLVRELSVSERIPEVTVYGLDILVTRKDSINGERVLAGDRNVSKRGTQIISLSVCSAGLFLPGAH